MSTEQNQMNPEEIKALFKAAEKGTLPQDFNQWELRNEYEETIAHIMAIYGTLTDSFNQWALRDRRGRSVAHMVVYRGHLPPDFNRWE
jgi:hypothetical protein